MKIGLLLTAFWMLLQSLPGADLVEMPQPKAHWTFDEIVKNKVKEFGSTRFPGLIDGEVTLVPGKVGQALHFSQDEGNLEIEVEPEPDKKSKAPSKAVEEHKRWIGYEMTVAFWVRADNPIQIKDYQTLFFFSQNCVIRFGNKKLNVACDNDWHAIDIEDLTPFNRGWTHVTVTLDSTITKVYLNGVLAGSHDMMGSRIFGRVIWLGSRPIQLEPDRGKGEKYFDRFLGDLDELYIYDKVLTPEQVAVLATP